jgi:hypothetical protein
MGDGGARDEALVPAVAQHELSRVDPGLAAVVSMGMTHHVVGKTRSGYKSARSSYLRFCSDRGLEPWPVSEVVLAAWLHFIVVTVAVSSMGVYMAGLAYYQGLMGMPWRLAGSELVRRTMRYLKRKFPVAGGKQKAPVTVALLRVLLPLLKGWPLLDEMSQDDRTFATASVLAVAGFLRGGEFLCSASSDRKLLLLENICVKQQGGSWAVGIAIPQPKAMFWLETQEVLCFAAEEGVDDTFCPVRLWEGYVRSSVAVFKQGGPAFVMSNGKALSRNVMVKRTAELMSQAGVLFVDAKGEAMEVKASSWRAGAVRSALDANIATPFIMASGRWKSAAWIKYAVEHGLDLRQTARTMWAPAKSRAPDSSSVVVQMFDPAVLLADEDEKMASMVKSSFNLN